MKDSSYPQPYISGLSVRGAARITNEAKRFPGQLRGAPNGTFGNHSGICPNADTAAWASRGRAPTPFLENLTFPPPQLKRQRPCDDQSLKPQVSSLGNTPVFKQSIHRLARDSGLLHPGLRFESSPESPPGKSGPQDAVTLGGGTGWAVTQAWGRGTRHCKPKPHTDQDAGIRDNVFTGDWGREWEERKDASQRRGGMRRHGTSTLVAWIPIPSPRGFPSDSWSSVRLLVIVL